MDINLWDITYVIITNIVYLYVAIFWFNVVKNLREYEKPYGIVPRQKTSEYDDYILTDDEQSFLASKSKTVKEMLAYMPVKFLTPDEYLKDMYVRITVLSVIWMILTLIIFTVFPLSFTFPITINITIVIFLNFYTYRIWDKKIKSPKYNPSYVYCMNQIVRYSR